MNIKDILNESATDLVANLYPDANHEVDDLYNPQAKMIADTNSEYYAEYFSEFEETGRVPVFTESDNNVAWEDQQDWDNHPGEGQMQSAGYRGQQRALGNAGVPHASDAQKYDPSAHALALAMCRDPK